MNSRAACILTLFAAATPLFGQSVISARSGIVNYFEGDVVANGERLQKSFGAYTKLKEGSDLVTRSGRAEVLLAPSIYLRLGADSSVRMVADSLTNTKVELLGGSAIVDSSAGDSQKTPVTLLYKDATVRIDKTGQYRIDSEPPQFRVFQGSAKVERNGETVALSASQLLPLDGASVVRKFTEGSDNLLDIWSDERHLLISSNIADSQSIKDPLIDPDPDPSTVAGLGAYLGYIPLSVQPPPAGVYGSGGYGAYGSFPPVYGGYSSLYYPYPGVTPYYGFFGLTPLIVPAYMGSTVNRFGSIYAGRPIGSLPGIGVRPPIGTGTISSPIRVGVPGTIRPGVGVGAPVATRPGVGAPVARPGIGVRAVGGHR